MSRLRFKNHEECGGVGVFARKGERAILPLDSDGFKVARMVQHMRGDDARVVHALDCDIERTLSAVVADQHETALLVGREAGEGRDRRHCGRGGYLLSVARDNVAEYLERPVGLVEFADAVLVAPVPGASGAIVVGLVEAGVLEAGEHGEIERGGVDAVVGGGSGVGLAYFVRR